MSKPITDGAEVSIEFPDKAYIGFFRRDSSFSVDQEADGIVLKLVHPGDDRRVAAFHLHYHLLADVLAALADSLSSGRQIDDDHRSALVAAAEKLAETLASPSAPPRR